MIKKLSKLKKSNTNNIGKIVKNHRTKIGHNLSEYAKRFNISAAMIHNIENGKSMPSLDLWLMMAQDIGLKKTKAVFIHVVESLPSTCKSCIKESEDSKAVFPGSRVPIRYVTRINTELSEKEDIKTRVVCIRGDYEKDIAYFLDNKITHEEAVDLSEEFVRFQKLKYELNNHRLIDIIENLYLVKKDVDFNVDLNNIEDNSFEKAEDTEE